MNQNDAQQDLDVTRLVSDAFLVLAVVGFGSVYGLGLMAGNLPEIAMLKGAAALVLVVVAGRIIDRALAQRQPVPAAEPARKGTRLDVRLDDAAAAVPGVDRA